MNKHSRLLCALCAVLLTAGGAWFGWRVLPAWLPPEITPSQDTEAEAYAPRATQGLDDAVYAGDSLLYYFYRPACPYCSERADMVLAGLPDEITLPDGTRSRVVIVPVDKSGERGGELIEAYYAEQNVPLDQRKVPALLIGEDYLSGTGAIKQGFLTCLLRGDGLETALLTGAGRQP